jgi:hypothetical protein
VFDENPFVELVDKKGIVAGLFVTDPISKVDRLDTEQKNFHVKSSKTEDNLDLFWGVLKFDGADLAQMVNDNVFDSHTEIGNILNLYEKTYVTCKSYLDLGTWSNYNRYLASTYNFSNIEVEKKYDAEGVNPGDFIAHFQDRGGKLLEITSTDHYHVSNNSNIEFIRYRGNSEDGTVPSPDITIKNYNRSQLNRFELVVPLSPDADSKNVLHFLKLLGANYLFSVTKKCYIFTFEEYTAVYYEFEVKEKLFKIIEIELHKIDFNIISKLESEMTAIPEFNPMLTINKSKFQIIKDNM